MVRARDRIVKGLGPRYGFTVRRRYADVLYLRRLKYKCPRCELSSLKRLSVGIWHCAKCDYTFAGGAYVPTTKIGDTATRSFAVEEK